MTARTRDPIQILEEQLREQLHTRRWYWEHKPAPRMKPARYAKATVRKIRAAVAELD